MPGTLYIVATPIGNLEDITYRAIRILREADLIAAEDTRHSRKLLAHYGISRPLTSYFDHNKTLKGDYILDRLREGLSVALISDAGTPCISDPGYQLVRDAVEAQIPVVPVPGACAAIAALSAAGLPTDAFVFEGFLPNRRSRRREKLAAVAGERRVLIFYESPNRLADTLLDLFELYGDRQAVVARELTKIHEEFARGTISTLRERFQKGTVRGEVVLLVMPAEEAAPAEGPAVADLLLRYIETEGLSVKDAVRRVALETGSPRSEVYDEALRMKQER
ncbi:16S rRNA (cytidine(1402)-2'-O)-methyltransferase [Geobacter sp. DSM 9736]|uniref:16S rRNA (cytidine(1402)-2'-O)-methyltransferase n=1 Tax=Geobacter sp. DSM 9736 TaxID=1277350 RepID=UPI000B5101CA|nr:16S rRNA (cytidine(1402)-2'-O)-methyltransferase [Geobacter sp. DSM 9736]SNB46356.1 16S rRNA (cytidine1402-2'-O)-methyltransferase [Geobacter sp. DSM 9736]